MQLLSFYKNSSWIFKIGFWLEIIIVLFGVVTPYWMSMKGLMDFPCDADGIPLSYKLPIQDDSRIVYCISVYSREFGGGGIYAQGVSNENTVSIEPHAMVEGVTIKRSQEDIVVEGHLLIPLDSQGFEKSFTAQSINPWLLLTAKMVINNNGPLHDNNQVLYVKGEVYEGWRYSPVGITIVLIGFGLMFTERIRHQHNVL